jgi:hypothetical protein
MPPIAERCYSGPQIYVKNSKKGAPELLLRAIGSDGRESI